MTNDHECKQSYGEILKIIQEYLQSQSKEGESLSAEIYGSYGRDCYICIDYDTIIDKKHISEFEHLPPSFMGKPFIRDIIPQILDNLLKQWRQETDPKAG